MYAIRTAKPSHGPLRARMDWHVGKTRFDLAAITLCGHLSNWIDAPKQVEETLRFVSLDPRNGASQWAPLRCQDYHSSNLFRFRLELRKGRLYSETQFRQNGSWQQVYLLGSAHPQVEAEYVDQCCLEPMFKDRGYEKRYAESCQDRRGRRHVAALTIAKLDAFYDGCAGHLSIKRPDTPLEVAVRPPTLPAEEKA